MGKRHKTTKTVCDGLLLSTALPCREQKTHKQMPQRCIRGKFQRTSHRPSIRIPPPFPSPRQLCSKPRSLFPFVSSNSPSSRRAPESLTRTTQARRKIIRTFIFRLSGAHLENVTRPFRPSRTLSERSTTTSNTFHHRGAQLKTSRGHPGLPEHFSERSTTSPIFYREHRVPENLARPPGPVRIFS